MKNKSQSKPSGFWKIQENCIDISKLYDKPSDLEKDYPAAYNSIYKNKWQDICYSHMKRNKPNNFYTLEICKELSLNYELPSDLQDANSMAYSVIIKNKWQDICFSHMANRKKPKGYWDSKENCLAVALTCDSPSELEKKYGAAYAKICENNWKEEAYSHMVSIKKENGFYTKEKLIEISLQYSSIQDIREKDNGAYQTICRNNWNAECFSHMKLNVFTQAFKISLTNLLENSDLLSMDPFEIYTIIQQGNLPKEFEILTQSQALSEERSIMITQLKDSFKNEKKTQDKKTLAFIEKANKIHYNKYDYSESIYLNAKEKIKIKCQEHNLFEQTPNDHLNGKGCKFCAIQERANKLRLTSKEFITKSNKIHNNKYDYSLSVYTNGQSKVKIICPIHGEFEQRAHHHMKGIGCDKCGGSHKYTTKEFIEKAKEIHGNQYNYSLTNYIDAKTKTKIICSIHGEFEQTPSQHLIGSGCDKCGGTATSNTNEFIIKAKKIHGNKYDYSGSIYYGSKEKIIINCPIHGLFEQIAKHHLKGSQCPICNHGWTNEYKLKLLNTLDDSDLLNMDAFEIYTIIRQGKLPNEFSSLANMDTGSEDRVTTLQELKARFTSKEDEDTIETETIDGIGISEECLDEIVPIDDVDLEITQRTTTEARLPNIAVLNDLHSLDNNLYATMDKEAFESLIQYKLRKLWNGVLNNDISLDTLRNETGGQYFLVIKALFFDEYVEVEAYKPKIGYSFKYQPNLMQKLCVIRLLKNKAYGNWSGTGAGKTLSFIIASREIEARLTIIIALNSTIKQTCDNIKNVYPNSYVFTEYKVGQVFDRSKYNYLVLNYEKFQQEYSESLFQDLTNNNQIDFVVIDEVHNTKQRQEDVESIRRAVLNRLLGRIREKNIELHTLVMSATPVVNNLFEAKSLLQLMTGLEYNDIDTRRTLGNALKIFQQLILNGLRYIPKYDMEMLELTSSNMSNLDINGSHLLDAILDLSESNHIDIEKLLLPDKLKATESYFGKGVILYSYYTTGFITEIEAHAKSCGYSVGTYTGDESLFIREENLKKFISGEIDMLIGSKPIGTGVDGLQGVCYRTIIYTLPWTDSEYTQLKGRTYRQGSLFGSIEMIIPQVRIDLEEGDFWSWDIQRLNVIKNKKTLADAAVDGVVPSRILPKPSTMFRKTQESLQCWKDRINNDKIIESSRTMIKLDLYPDIIDDKQRQARIQSELSEFNRRGKTTKSSTMHKEFTDNPDSWFRYHALRKERMGQWDEIPYEYIATKIRNKNHKIVDFGCGENLFKNCVPNNEVISFDHIAIDDSVIACDMKDISQYVDNESIDVCVFSLALWGVNHQDYIREAYRILNYGGVIHIAEPVKHYETPQSKSELMILLTNEKFKTIGEIEVRGKFIYLTGIKM